MILGRTVIPKMSNGIGILGWTSFFSKIDTIILKKFQKIIKNLKYESYYEVDFKPNSTP